MKPIRFTRHAEGRLAAIAAWTVRRFGPAQADHYEAELLERVKALGQGALQGKNCAALAPDALGADRLRFVQVGAHYLIYSEGEQALTILDIVHGAQNLPAILHRLGRR